MIFFDFLAFSFIIKIVKNSHQIQLFFEPVEFFRHLVTNAIESQRVSINEEAEYYLVMLLSHFMQSETMRQSEKDPLAIKLQKAMTASKIEKIQLLKQMGDFSLYISGFFSDSLKRKLVDIDYYIAMGETAYQSLSRNLNQEALQTLYQDLCTRFGIYVDILSEVSENTFLHTNRDILRTYEKWLMTRSVRLSKLLRKEGLLLDPHFFNKPQ